jgi:hypothetical protein
MKLRAKNRIEGKETINPGQQFDCTDEKEAKRLIDLGAAEDVVIEAPAPQIAPVIPDTRPNAREMIAKVNECKTVEAVQALIQGEARLTVKDAAEKRIQELAKELDNQQLEHIELIEACDTIEEVNFLLDGETRQAVLDAAEKKKSELSASKG